MKPLYPIAMILISIHAPVKGATMLPFTVTIPEEFQSTHP